MSSYWATLLFEAGFPNQKIAPGDVYMYYDQEWVVGGNLEEESDVLLPDYLKKHALRVPSLFDTLQWLDQNTKLLQISYDSDDNQSCQAEARIGDILIKNSSCTLLHCLFKLLFQALRCQAGLDWDLDTIKKVMAKKWKCISANRYKNFQKTIVSAPQKRKLTELPVLLSNQENEIKQFGFVVDHHSEKIMPYDYIEYHGQTWIVGGCVLPQRLECNLAPVEIYQEGKRLISINDLILWLEHRVNFRVRKGNDRLWYGTFLKSEPKPLELCSTQLILLLRDMITTALQIEPGLAHVKLPPIYEIVD